MARVQTEGHAGLVGENGRNDLRGRRHANFQRQMNPLQLRPDPLVKAGGAELADTRRLYRQIADQLARFIETNSFAVGAKLPTERELAEMLGVSRPSVREGLIALEVEGVVEVRGGSGVFVASRKQRAEPPVAAPAPGPFDVIKARWLFESEAAALAAVNANAQQLQQMNLALKVMREAPTHSAAGTAADERFHMAIAEASGNAAVAQVIAQLWKMRTGTLYMQMESHFIGADIWAQACAEHAELMDAIASRDPDAAREAMRKHMKNAELRFAAAWKSID
jgi:DNA-binding FadR family transcriptional regulator